jgi:hypothetical protein
MHCDGERLPLHLRVQIACPAQGHDDCSDLWTTIQLAPRAACANEWWGQVLPAERHERLNFNPGLSPVVVAMAEPTRLFDMFNYRGCQC